MRHKQSTIEFAQGWLGNELTEAAASQKTPEGEAVGEKVLSMWNTIDEAIDDLLAERKVLLAKLDAIQRAL